VREIRISDFDLVAVSRQRFQQPLGVGLMQHAGATQIASSLLRHAAVQVAGASAAVFDLAFGRGAKPLLNALVCLHLRHVQTRWQKAGNRETSDFSRPGPGWEVEVAINGRRIAKSIVGGKSLSRLADVIAMLSAKRFASYKR
jgi:hypothetical protein